MRGVDFQEVRRRVRIEQALELLNFAESRRRTQGGDQLRGKCPFADCGRDDVFCVNLASQVWFCQKCRRGKKGTVLDLWAGVQQLRLYEAAIDLCKQLNIDVPYLAGKK